MLERASLGRVAMPVKRLDHVNLRTARLAEMIAWYRDMLGLEAGWRPDFAVNGAWLYIGDQAAVHLVEVAEHPPVPEDPLIEHFALAAEGLADFIALAERRGESLRLARVPNGGPIQVNIWDPDGNHIHVDFAAEEAEGLDLGV